ncbi:rod shape-determining protein MreB [Sporolactobacillus inulinus]|uniref:Rod shape-determining protein MreB n=1 Tax=Sporolactobacillus inulinus TaxID=2078 RepID=A0A4Y1ZBH9_9BACL|nr:rod shape-determining protein MreB [Sporolactobacillus inulinus]
MLIGERTAEQIKITVGTVYKNSRDESMDIRGRDMVTGLPKTMTVHSNEIEAALSDSVNVIVSSAKAVLEQTPPELSADIIDRGVIMTGGGAQLHGIDQLLASQLKVPVVVADNPMTCVVEGAGKMLEHLDKLPKRKAN